MDKIIIKDTPHLVTTIKDHMNQYGENCDLNHLDISHVSDCNSLFSGKYGLHKFNGDISNWDTSKVTDMGFMFFWSQFKGNISKWNTSQVSNMEDMFSKSQFNQDISGWNTSNVINMSDLFSASPFNQDISQWDTSKVSDISGMFSNSPFNQDISQWDTSKVTNMDSTFWGTAFTIDISQWNIDSLVSSTYMFYNCKNYFIPEWADKNKEQLQAYRNSLILHNELDNQLQYKSLNNTKNRSKLKI